MKKAAIPSQALLLTAGLGTRLRPLTLVRAKAALPVAGETLVRRIVRWLVGHGVTDLVANLHHLPESIAKDLGDGTDLGARVRYSWEQPAVLGSAGGPRQALPILEADTFLVVNGDTLTNVDLRSLAVAHAEARPTGTLATLAVVPNTRPEHYGGVKVDDEGNVVGFVPRGRGAERSWHFIGVQIVEASAFRDLPLGQPTNSVGGVYDRLMAARRGNIRAFPSNADYWDIGTVGDYWATWFRLSGKNPDGESILWDNVQVGAGAALRNCIVTDDVAVPPGARFDRQILLRAEDGSISSFPFEPGPIA
jgi:NDP-sugar pyrophosphorylase family protein